MRAADDWHSVCRIAEAFQRKLIAQKETRMPAVTALAHAKGDYFVDYEEKVFEDVKADNENRKYKRLIQNRVKKRLVS